ncbi:MAG: MobA/MobL family protein [Lachnospiraceae bacterium]|nr:MobA/MobL family protein [Lachnospiraceae bacterium]
MAIYHLEAKVISRGAGRSACAAAAYMSCSRIYNDYDGVQHDYTRKQGLVWQQIFLPEYAPREWQDREVLWNAVEENEKTKDSRLAREFVAALPVELNKVQWQALLTEFVQEQFVADGMCADVCIHDTDGRNPHAHIMLTVRPLDEQGKWQYKTQKEYLCVRGGEEREFTAAELKTAQADGWEKQYPYIPEKGKKKIYLPPSEADRRGLIRADKHPKSTKYGRQNPIAAKWNSEEQLLTWRAAWADAVNRCLEKWKCSERIDHRSHAERRIDEQPTIHEGVTAGKLEYKGIVSDRRELNRQIKADNELLRELKAQIKKLTNAVKEVIPAVAETLEKIREHMVTLQYHLLHNSAEIANTRERFESASPIMAEYKSVKKQLRQKQETKQELLTQKENTGFFNSRQRKKLDQQITALTEEIEELKTRKTYLMYKVSCQNETEMKEAEKTLLKMSDYMEKLDTQQKQLNAQLAVDEEEYGETLERVDSEQENQLLEARIPLRSSFYVKIREKLHEIFGQKFKYDRVTLAERLVDHRLGENPALYRERASDLRREQEKEQGRSQSIASKKKSRSHAR